MFIYFQESYLTVSDHSSLIRRLPSSASRLAKKKLEDDKSTLDSMATPV